MSCETQSTTLLGEEFSRRKRRNRSTGTQSWDTYASLSNELTHAVGKVIKESIGGTQLLAKLLCPQ